MCEKKELNLFEHYSYASKNKTTHNAIFVTKINIILLPPEWSPASKYNNNTNNSLGKGNEDEDTGASGFYGLEKWTQSTFPTTPTTKRNQLNRTERSDRLKDP